MFRPARARGFPPLLVCSLLIVSAPGVFAQEKKAPNRESSRSLYKSWLNDDARYLITDDERRAFLALKTPWSSPPGSSRSATARRRRSSPTAG